MLKTLMSQIKQYKTTSIMTALLTILEASIEISIPLVAAMIIDEGISKGNMSNVLLYGAIMICMAGCSLLFGILAGRFSAVASTGFAKNLREAMFKNIQTFSFSNIDKFSTAGLVTRLTTDVTNVQNSYQMLMRLTLRSPINLVIAMSMSYFINSKIANIFLIAMVFLIIVFTFIIRNAMKYFTEVFKGYDNLNMSVQENVNAIRVVKAFVREEHEKTKFAGAAENLYNLFIKAEKIVSLNAPTLVFTLYSCMLGIGWFGAMLINSGEMTTGNLSSLFIYAVTILISLMMISMVFVMLSMSVASGQRIAEVLTEKADIVNGENPVSEVRDGSIIFQNVEFAYNLEAEKPALIDINVEIKSGETIGIIGNTGSGKTSFVNLISRLYDVTKGRVLVGGVDVRDYDIETLRNNVSVVLQKNELFSGTILDNLRWGNENATEEECKNACVIAHADEFIERMPQKYHSEIERGGTNVSGGQKQRLCIARALLKTPKVLILDDSTSAVDTATDEKIRAEFRKGIPDVTKLIISQRISGIQDSDRIIVLNDGVIDGFGTHEELLGSNVVYKTIFDSQTQGDADFDERRDD